LWFGYGESYKSERHQKGIFGLSNAELDSSWPKVEKGKDWLRESAKNGGFDFDAAMDLLGDRSKAPKDQLPSTGVSLELEEELSALNIHYGNYGTRVSTVMAINREGNTRIQELNRLSGELTQFEIKKESFIQVK
jgi:uncharacterized protein with NRDE domain